VAFKPSSAEQPALGRSGALDCRAIARNRTASTRGGRPHYYADIPTGRIFVSAVIASDDRASRRLLPRLAPYSREKGYQDRLPASLAVLLVSISSDAPSWRAASVTVQRRIRRCRRSMPA